MPWQTAVPDLNPARNNFDLMRLLLALTVMLSHARVLSGAPELDVILQPFDSRVAIEGFFAISGFLVFRSWQGSNGLWDYAVRRFRRIYPAYAAVVILGLLIGVFATVLTVDAFFRSGQTWRYLLANLAFLNFLENNPPGLFAHLPRQAINGSLWTIKVEVGLYVILPAIAFMFRGIGPIVASFLVYAASLVWGAFFIHLWPYPGGQTLALQSPGFASFFVVGMAFAAAANLYERLGLVALVSGALWLFLDEFYSDFAFLIRPLALSAIVLFLASKAFVSIPVGKLGDLSYGVYLMHFPLVQLFMFLGVFQLGAWIGLGSSVFAVLVLSWLSWKLVEKPFLRRSSHYIRAEAT